LASAIAQLLSDTPNDCAPSYWAFAPDFASVQRCETQQIQLGILRRHPPLKDDATWARYCEQRAALRGLRGVGGQGRGGGARGGSLRGRL